MPKLSVVIPFYNEPSLAPLLAELDIVGKKLGDLGFELETIFVDDGSESRTSLNELLEYKERNKQAKVIRLARNFGSFHAIKTGFSFVSGDCFATLSADLQDPPSLLVEMAEKWQSGSKFVICVRGEREDPFSTRAFAALYYTLIRATAIRDFPKSGYDLALMDKVFLPHLQQSSVQINYRLLAYWLGFDPDVIVYKREKRVAGESHWGLGKRINLFIDSIIGFSIWPARAIVFLGAAVSLISIIVLGTQFLSVGIAEGSALTLATALSLISLLFGLSFIALGIVAEYLQRIYAIVTGKPEVIIEQVY
jgi:dolichol-phosphate mannosyltransferase